MDVSQRRGFMDHTKQLGEEGIWKLLMKFSIPAIVGMLVNALYNIVDRAFVGHGVGYLAITGISFVFPIMTIIMAFGMLVGIGATALISIRLGQKNKDEAEIILANTLVLLIIVSIAITIIGLIFCNPIIKAFGATGEVFSYSKQYITIILIGTIAQMMGFGLNNIIRADGKPMIAMGTMIIGAVINAILNPIFIFVFHFGIKGSAFATIISQTISAVWVLSYFFNGKSMLKITKENLKLNKKIIFGIFSIGLSPFLMQVAASAIGVMLNTNLLKYGGNVAVGAMGAINAVAMLILMPIFGINQGVQPIIGYNYGAKKYDRVKKALRIAIASATAITITGFIFVELFPTMILSIFNSSDKEFARVGAHGIRIFLMMLPILGFQIVSSNYFQATGRPKHSIFLSLIRQVIVLIPLIYILPHFLHLNGVWIAGPTSDFIASLVTALMLFRELAHLDIKHAESIQVE
jgi:putative MATE family efflux protein